MSTSDPAAVPPARPRRRPTLRHGLAALLVVGATILGLELAFVVSAGAEVGCGLCHVPSQAADDLSRSIHKDTDCINCHALPGVAGVVRYNLQAADHFVTWLARRSTSSGTNPGSVASTCVRCHEDLQERVVTNGAVKMSHRQVIGSAGSDSPNTEVPCTLCHARIAHTPVSGGVGSMDPHSMCVGCHDGVIASRQCATCHAETPSVAQSEALAGDPHPPGWADRHGMGDQATCSLCHEGTYCESCHEVALPHDPATYMYTHGDEAVSAGKACLSCHSQSTCDDCHQIPMPHAEGFLEQHGAQAEDSGIELCAGCHVREGCDSCHLQHIHPGVPDVVKEKVGALVGSASESGSADPSTSSTQQGP